MPNQPLVHPVSSQAERRRLLNLIVPLTLPDPNPLQLPTKSDEIRLQGTQPITLQEAIALAERNSRDLQVAALTLRRSQTALRQARAALYPTLTSDAELGYERNSRERSTIPSEVRAVAI